MGNIKTLIQKHLSILIMCLTMSSSLLVPMTASAANTAGAINSVTNVICAATNTLTGTIGRSIAIIVVAGLAISLFLGKVSWGLAIATIVGMGILFGAQSVVGLLSGNSSFSCGN